MATEQSTEAAIEKVLGLDKPKRENVYRKVEGKGTLLPPELRELPGDLVTKEAEEEDKVHPLDPEHIRLNLKDEYFEKQQAESAPEPEKPLAEWRPVKQEFVDLIILNVLAACIETASNRLSRGEPMGAIVKHLRFPRNDITEYMLRDGNPPADSERHPHERGIDLVVDLTRIPPRIMDQIRSNPRRRAIYGGTLMEQVTRRSWEREQEDMSDDNQLIVMPQ